MRKRKSRAAELLCLWRLRVYAENFVSWLKRYRTPEALSSSCSLFICQCSLAFTAMDLTSFKEGFTLQDLMNSKGFTLTRNPEDDELQVIDDNYLDSSEDEPVRTIIASPSIQAQVPQYRSFDDLATTMKDLVDSGYVKIHIISEGIGPKVPKDAYVKVHYAAYFENEELPFDNTMAWNAGEPVQLQMGVGKIIAGLEIGLEEVRGPKAKFLLLLAPEAMYGKLGVLPRVRPERALYSVSLEGVEDIGLVNRFTSLPSDEQRKFSTTLPTVEASNERAKVMFSKRRYGKAVESYVKSIEVLTLSAPETEEEISKVKELLAKVYTNMATCYTKLKRPQRVLQMLDNLTRLGPIVNNARALYLYGKAQSNLGEYEEGLKFLRMAQKLQPKSEEVAEEIIKLDKKISEYKKSEKALWQGALCQKTEKKRYDVEEDFIEDTTSMLEQLSTKNGFVEFKLPDMTDDEIGFTKQMVEGFKNLTFVEDELKCKKKYKIVKKE